MAEARGGAEREPDSFGVPEDIGIINESADGRPTPIGMSISDVLGGLNGAAAVLAALVHRQRTGEGQQIWVDLLGSTLAALGEHLVHMLNNGADEPARVTPMHGHGYIPPPYGFYATKDGYLALSSGRQIREICEIVGLPADVRRVVHERRPPYDASPENSVVPVRAAAEHERPVAAVEELVRHDRRVRVAIASRVLPCQQRALGHVDE